MGYLRVRHLGKAYKRYPRKWGRLAEWLGLGRRHHLRWILRYISFDIAPGEAVGIIGINGAGKSTLLKMIAGTTRPTTGTVEAGGRIAALLELGIGFHPDFTGRQNVYMSGQLAGLDNPTIAAKMGEIEAFAGIGDYIDQPVRTYSSGMQVRLAFSVATAVRPDILVVDEALAVGDIFFQQKCFERIARFRDAGTTLLFVSHAMSTVYSLCGRAILLDGGRVALDGEPRQVIDLYNAHAANQAGSGALQVVGGGGDRAPGSYFRGGVEIRSVTLLYRNQPVHSIASESDVAVRVRVAFQAAFDDPHIGFQVRDRRGEALFMTHTHGMGRKIGPVAPGTEVEVSYAFNAALAPGEYTVTAGVADTGLLDGRLKESLARVQDAWHFTVAKNLDAIAWDGLYNLAPTCEIRVLPGAGA